MQKAIAKAKQEMANSKAATIYTIPVVVHVYHKEEAIGTGTNIAEAVINSQITVLNQDFRRMTGRYAGGNANTDGVVMDTNF